jgi:hypothetical protein
MPKVQRFVSRHPKTTMRSHPTPGTHSMNRGLRNDGVRSLPRASTVHSRKVSSTYAFHHASSMARGCRMALFRVVDLHNVSQGRDIG